MNRKTRPAPDSASLALHCGARLRERDQAASGVQLQLRFAGRTLLTRSRKLPAAR
ncbi:hypothetical protein SAMN05216532_8175 [Streptomyces sp. 2231.1]|uniref:DinB/UmuC family translesion DNA polymerase n=1 Tax=Streptomyces sp. 2231.1 TaxID=1855347 RepID=UPI000896F6AA|nr:hypothetical protein [Streptomyces sp. 2231.1]SEE65520.1 hypothetical protein SAMN05216532_8175 [Streptomyces sp. 2231.1]